MHEGHILERQASDNMAAAAAAESVLQCLPRRHRGALGCKDRFIICGNDSYSGKDGR
jgi:hypothetical protein